MKFLKIYLLILIFLPTSLFSQVFQKDYSTLIDSIPSEKKIYLHILGTSFFNNNEFFNEYQPGYTLIGGFLQPKLNYAINPKLVLSTGIHLVKYYGDEGFTHTDPLFNINYKVNDALSITMGSFEGGQNHKLPETVFAFENHFSGLTENGIQIRFNKRFLESEIWLDWEKFIESGDPFREEFMVGMVNRAKLFNSNEKLRIQIPIYILAHHAGGQINIGNQAVESLYNISEGFKIYRPANPGVVLKSIYSEVLFHHSPGYYSTGTGSAVQITGGVEIQNFEINAGFFRGNNFMSFRGLSLYHSYLENQISGYSLGGTTEIINFKAGLRVKIAERSFLFLRFEGYYNTTNKNFDYTYGLHMQVNEHFRLFRLKL